MNFFRGIFGSKVVALLMVATLLLGAGNLLRHQRKPAKSSHPHSHPVMTGKGHRHTHVHRHSPTEAPHSHHHHHGPELETVDQKFTVTRASRGGEPAPVTRRFRTHDFSAAEQNFLREIFRPPIA